MKNYFSLACILFFQAFILTGCGIGGFWMNGNPNLSESVPLRADWQKDSNSTADLVQDWIECGGDSKGWYYVERSPTDTGQSYQSKSSLKHYAIQRCMLAKGYQYIGRCDNAIRQATPACNKNKIVPHG